MNKYFLLSNIINERSIVTIITFALIAAFLILLAFFLVLDYKNTKTNDLRNMLYRNSQKLTKNEVLTVYSDKSKNFSGTEILPIPKKAPTNQYNFEFAGWDKNYFNESGDTVVKAVFIKRLNSYVVNFYSDDKTTLLKTVEVKYGQSADVSDLNPKKDETDEFSYEFDGWSKDISSIVSDENIYAVFKAYPKKFTYTFLDSDKKTVIMQETAIFGTPIIFPSKPTPPNENLKFSHWENYIFEMPLKKDETFIAVYKEKENKISSMIENESLDTNEENFENLEEKSNIEDSENLNEIVEDKSQNIENDLVINTEEIKESEYYEDVNIDLEMKSATQEAEEYLDEVSMILDELSNMPKNVDEEIDVINEEIVTEENIEENDDNEIITDVTNTGDYFSYDEDAVFEELSEDIEDLDEFYEDLDNLNDSETINNDAINNNENLNDNEQKSDTNMEINKNNRSKTQVIQEYYWNNFAGGKGFNIDSSENQQKPTTSNPATPANQERYSININGNNIKNNSTQKVDENNQPLYGLAGIMNPKMMVQNGYNLNNLSKEDYKKGSAEQSQTQENSNNYSKVNQSEKITYNKINKTEKIIYNNVDDKQDIQIDKKTFNGSGFGGQNILFNNSRKVNNANVSIKNNEETEDKPLNEINAINKNTINSKDNIAVKNNARNLNANRNGLVNSISSFIEETENKNLITKLNIENKNVKINYNNENTQKASSFDAPSSSKLTSYEQFDDDDGEVLPKISVISAQKKTEANRKLSAQNRPQNPVTIQVRQNSQKMNGVMFNGLINDSEYKTVQQMPKTNKSEIIKNEDNDVFFGTVMINRKNKK